MSSGKYRVDRASGQRNVPVIDLLLGTHGSSDARFLRRFPDMHAEQRV